MSFLHQFGFVMIECECLIKEWKFSEDFLKKED